MFKKGKKQDDELSEQLKHPAAFGAFVRGDEKNFVVAATPGGIEAQEKAGQGWFVERQMLPKEGTVKEHFYHRDGEPTAQAQLEKLGFVFGREVDDLFIECQLPPGWKKEATDHSMWSILKDGQGRERAAIFYKAAFYDRTAHCDLKTRFTIRRWYAASPDEPENLKGTPEQVCAVVMDAGKPIWHSPPVAYEDWEGKEKQQKAARTWLEQHYPKWEDPFSYWN